MYNLPTKELLKSNPMNYRRERIIMLYTNLENTGFPEKFKMTTNLESLLMHTKDDAYALSMPLLISSQLGNRELYKKSISRMNKAMTQLAADPFKAWMYGRILISAHNIDDRETVAKTQITLSTLLDDLVKSDTTRFDRFTIWALGYIAATSKDEFSKARAPMIAGGNYLTKEYLNIYARDVSEEKKQEARSDALWAWVMISQAAANSGEKEEFENAINQMLTITQQTSIGTALSVGLLRTAASNDFPAWAMGIVRLAAQVIGDETRYSELEAPLNTSISEAEVGNYRQDALLASVNSQLAMERAKLTDAICTVHQPQPK